MRPAVFVDSSGWLAALSSREAQHREALEAYLRLADGGGPLVTTNLVVAETHALWSKAKGPSEGLRFLDSVHSDPVQEVVFVDRDLEARAIDRWLRSFRDQRFSLCDAVSFELMRQEGIRAALTLDKDFAVAGFEMVP